MKLNYMIHCIGLLIGLAACDSTRIFEQNIDFDNKVWLADSSDIFDFIITDIDKPYNIYLNIRNTNTYPYYNLYVKYSLEDTLGNTLHSELINTKLFHEKSGKPYGSGLGDIFTHQFDIKKGFTFQKEGAYQIRLQQYMRLDSLKGIVSAGIRVETSQ